MLGKEQRYARHCPAAQRQRLQKHVGKAGEQEAEKIAPRRSDQMAEAAAKAGEDRQPDEPQQEIEPDGDRPVPPAEQQPRAAVAASKPARKVRHKAEEPVVMCNNECEADSVINDIWNFLSA